MMDIKHDSNIKHLEVSPDGQRARQQCYKPVTDEEKDLDRRVNLKLDICVTAILAINFILCGIDKTNVGFVATSSFVQDANLKRDDIPNSLSLFSATYVPLQPLSTMMNHIIGPRRWMAFQLLAWGSLCMAHAGIRNSATLIALRLLLGAAEAGFTQNGMYFMSTLYPKYSVGFRMGLFSGMYSIAGAFAGLIAYGLLRIDSPRVHGWQLVFLVEGGLTVVMAAVTFLVLPSSLEKAWFLNPSERQHAVHRMNIDLAGTQETAAINGGKITKRDIVDVAKDWRKLLIVACNVLAILPVTAFTTFLPLVVEGMGYEGTKASLMSVPPFVVGVAGLLIVVYSSDHFHERSLHTVAGMALGFVGCLVMAVTHLDQEQLRYGFAHVCMAGIFISGPLIAAWLANNTPWRGTRSVMLGVNGFSNLAGVIAGQIFKSKYAPSYRIPLIITMSLLVVGAVGFVFVRIMLMLENRRRAEIIKDWDEQDFEEEACSEVRRGDQRFTFVYGM